MEGRLIILQPEITRNADRFPYCVQWKILHACKYSTKFNTVFKVFYKCFLNAKKADSKFILYQESVHYLSNVTWIAESVIVLPVTNAQESCE